MFILWFCTRFYIWIYWGVKRYVYCLVFDTCIVLLWLLYSCYYIDWKLNINTFTFLKYIYIQTNDQVTLLQDTESLKKIVLIIAINLMTVRNYISILLTALLTKARRISIVVRILQRDSAECYERYCVPVFISAIWLSWLSFLSYHVMFFIIIIRKKIS